MGYGATRVPVPAPTLIRAIATVLGVLRNFHGPGSDWDQEAMRFLVCPIPRRPLDLAIPAVEGRDELGLGGSRGTLQRALGIKMQHQSPY